MNEAIDFSKEIPPLPQSYGTPRLICLCKDPHWAFVFWELPEETFEQACEELASRDVRRMLRVVRCTGNQREIVTDITVQGNIGRHYVYLNDPSHRYQVEYALSAEGRVVTVLTSNYVLVPPDTVSEETDEQWATIEELYRSYHTGEEDLHMSSPGLWSISSPQKKQIDYGLDLEVHTDLVIYGKAQPGSRVMIQGEAVVTHDDGSFSVRYGLPPGTFVYPVKAVSHQGEETRTIVPVVTRETY